MASSLERDHTWEEIANKFANHIISNKFMNIDRNHFIKWFMEREGVGVLFDWKLVARCYYISNQMNKEYDHFTLIVGGEGSGKSTLMAQMNSWIAPQTIIEDILFDMPSYIKRLQTISKDYKKNKRNKINKSLGLDEGAISLFSREALTRSNIVLAKSFFVQRFLNVHIGICIPHYWSLDKLIREHRIKTLIIVKRRGEYKCIVGRGIKILNKNGSKEKEKDLTTIPIPYGLFWDGQFSKDFPKNINKEEYEEHKFNHIKSFLDDARVEAQSVKMVKVGKIEKEFGIDRRTIISQIQNGDIEGKKIGNNWFVSYKSYENMLRV